MTPLIGRRVLDLSRYAPGPYCSLICASLGAEVIKVESPGNGDPLRALDPDAFRRLNAGKKSLVLDLKSPAGLEKALQLVRNADVLIESFRPGAMERLGLGYEPVRSLHPSIVYVSISGYGQTGPYAARAGHDVNYMASAGALDGVTAPLALQVADFAAGGLYAALGVVAALMENVGRHLDLSMQEGLLAMSMLSDGRAAEALSGRYPNYAIYETKDGRRLSVGALEPKFWSRFVGALGRDDLAGKMDDPDTRAELVRAVGTRTGEELEALFHDVDACVELSSAPGKAFQHEQAVYRGLSDRSFRLPFGLGTPKLAPAPTLGQHTDEILGSLS